MIVIAATREEKRRLHERRGDHVAGEMGPEIAGVPERNDDEAEQRGGRRCCRNDRDCADGGSLPAPMKTGRPLL